MYEEGKSWIQNDYYFRPEGKAARTFEYKVVGDTIINDTLAVKVRMERLDAPGSIGYGYVYEEGGIVYKFFGINEFDAEYEVDTTTCFHPVFNFNWEKGASVSDFEDVVDVKDMVIEGVTRRVLTLGKEGRPESYQYLIEGIGATDWYLLFSRIYNIPSANSFLGSELISCHQDGKCLFSRDKFYEQLKGTGGITDAAASANDGAAEGVYNLRGMPVASPAKGQIYIRGGKKAVW